MARLGRERILGGGDTGAGKTYAWTAIALALRGQAKFVVLQFDDGADKVIKERVGLTSGYLDVRNPRLDFNVNLFDVPVRWDDFYAQVTAIQGMLKNGMLTANDWIVFEGTDLVTQFLRYEYAEDVLPDQVNKGQPANKKDLPDSSWDAFKEKRKKGAPILEGGDYDAIYTELLKPINYLLMQIPCNIFAACAVEPFHEGQGSDSGANKAEKEFYASMGMPARFSGQRSIPKKFDSLIVFGKSLSTGYTFQVFKDRGRGRSDGQIAPRFMHKDFYQDFLVAIAGFNANPQQPVMVPPPPPGVG